MCTMICMQLSYFVVMVYDVLAPNRRHVTSSHHADYSMHYCNVKWPSWHLELPTNRMFVQQFFQIANKEISKVHITVPLWGDSIVIGGSPHKRRVTWKTSLFDDVIMDWRIPWGRKYHVTQYTRCTCIAAIKQTMLERGRNVDIPLVSFYRWVRFLRTRKLHTPWWRHQMETFSALLALCAGNSPPVPVNSPHKGQWRGALMFSFIYAWINDWVNNREAGDLRRQDGHYDVIVMTIQCPCLGQ